MSQAIHPIGLLVLVATWPTFALDAKPSAERAKVVEHRIKAAGDVTLRVREMGKGDAVLLLTGGPGFAGEQLFTTAAAIAKTHRAILPDQRGTGESRVDAYSGDAFSIDGAVADLESIRTAMKIDRWTLVGHSYGGLLSMAYAAKHPDRVVSLVLIGPAGIDSNFWGRYQQNLFARLDDQTRTAMQSISAANLSLEEMADLIRKMNRLMAPAMIANADAREALEAEMDVTRFEPRVNMAMQRHVLRYDFKPALASFKPPTLVIQGDGDPIGRETADLIVKTLPNAKLHVIDGCGHWPFLEKPDELFRAVAAFLKGK